MFGLFITMIEALVGLMPICDMYFKYCNIVLKVLSYCTALLNAADRSRHRQFVIDTHPL
jgi:hypothetical protein